MLYSLSEESVLGTHGIHDDDLRQLNGRTSIAVHNKEEMGKRVEKTDGRWIPSLGVSQVVSPLQLSYGKKSGALNRQRSYILISDSANKSNQIQ